MFFQNTKTKLSLKTKIFLRVLLLVLTITAACFQAYFKLHVINTDIHGLEQMRAQQAAVDGLHTATEDVMITYVEAIKNITGLPSQDFDARFQTLTLKAQASPELPGNFKEIFQNQIKDNYQQITVARAALARNDLDTARQTLYKSHANMAQILSSLRTETQILAEQYTHSRLATRSVVLSHPYEQLWILIGCMGLLLILGASLALDVAMPIREMAVHMIDASRDTTNARKYLLHTIRSDEIGVIQQALNELLSEVEFNVQRSLVAEALSLQRLTAIEAADEGIAIINQYGLLVYANRALFKLHGIAMNDSGHYINRSWKALYSPEAQAEIDFKVLPEIKRSGSWRGEEPILRKDDSIITAELSLTRLPDGGLVGTARDVSKRVTAEREKEQLQNQFIQVQKLESVGRLTGGIAHDFNNMLTIIDGNLDMALDHLAVDSDSAKYIKTAKRAILRGAELTQRLLAFSRSQTLKPKTVNLNVIIPEATMMIIRAIGEHVEIIFNLADDLAMTELDIGQFENALINLAINARDAMPDGGYIRIKTQNVVLDQDSLIHEGNIIAGDYVMIEIADTGCGIPAEMQHQIFDPFFTTKGVGEGSGLGLSMVYGFVKQSGGHIQVESKEGVGTALRLYFPRSVTEKPEAVPAAPHTEPDRALTGTETILLAEDESEILNLNREILTRLGYTVHCAPDGHEAVFMARQIDHIDLLITDIVMPGTLNGYAVAEEIKKIFPDAKTLFISGYAPPQPENGGSDRDAINLLSKPYISRQLAERVRDILDQPLDAAS